MKTNYTIKNFRVFDKNGVTVEIAPMTFLVGCNSSGKSSIVKSLTLLRTFFGNRFDKEHPVVGTTIDFSTKPNNTLGRFENVVHSSSRTKEVSFAYDTHSSYLNDDVTVELTMEAGDPGNARVKAVKISKKDGTVIITATSENSVSYNLSPIMESFRKFLVADKFRTDLKPLLPKYPEEGWDQANKEKSEKLEEDARRLCSSGYLLEIYKNREIKIEKDKYVTAAVDKFLETGILTYYSIFDGMVNMSNPEDVSRFLKSKVKDDELHDTLFNVIDYVAGLYAASGCTDFLAYFRSLDEKRLRVKDGMKSMFNFDVLNIRGLVENDFSAYEMLRFSQEDIICSISKDSSKMKEIDPYMFMLVNGMLSNLVDEDDLYSFVMKNPVSANCRMRIHPLWDALAEYVENFCMEVVSKDITKGLDYVSSSRIQVRRMYPMEDRNEFTDAVRRYFETRRKFLILDSPLLKPVDENGYECEKVSDFVPGAFMNKWLRIFKIGDHMSMEMDKNGLGLLLKLYLTPSDKQGVLLADMGYGITQLFSILLQIEEMAMSSLYESYKDIAITREDRKYITPKIVGDVKEKEIKARTLAIEEPEIHLHPKYQSLLAEMFYEAYKEFNIQFIIETHSEYLLRKIQTLVGAGKLAPEDVSLVYVEDDDEVMKGAEKVRRIQVKKDGRLASPFGSGFYDEADNLSMELFANMKR